MCAFGVQDAKRLPAVFELLGTAAATAVSLLRTQELGLPQADKYTVSGRSLEISSRTTASDSIHRHHYHTVNFFFSTLI